MLAKALSGEKLDDISNPEGLALRINQVFHERIAYSEPTQDNQIHFKSKSKFSYLSNFHPTLLLFRGRFYPSAEHAYQSNKFSDEEHKGLYDPHLPAQKLKKAFKTKNGHPPSPEDDQARLELMQAVVKAKFACNRALKEALIQTSPYELVEATDSEFWGKGRSGEGLNHLGKILMALRSDILETSKSN
ncbi:MAG: NADAR family protein [Parachlamydiales bacterium]|nr:NADAR family protein [Parachlamydiales bacterium]